MASKQITRKDGRVAKAKASKPVVIVGQIKSTKLCSVDWYGGELDILVSRDSTDGDLFALVAENGTVRISIERVEQRETKPAKQSK